MRIALDLTPLQRPVTGCDRYMLGLVAGLAALGADDAYVVFVNRGDAPGVLPPLPSSFRVITLPFRSRPARLAFQQVMLPIWLRRLGIDVLHSPSFFLPLAATRTRHVLTIHDLTFFTMAEKHNRLRRSLPFRAGLRASVRRADRVLVPSSSVAADLRRIAPGVPSDSVRVVPLGLAERFTPPPPARVAAVRGRFGIGRDYLLHVGTLEPRKNLDVLLDAFERLIAAGPPDLDLVLAGRTGWSVASLERRLRSPRLAGRVHRLGYVDDADLPALYAGARLFVFPSAYEGFGLPPLEAMACGTPVLASAAGALAENLAGAAELVDATPAALAAAIAGLADDPAALRALRAAGLERARAFRWERSARATHDCYRELARAR